MLSLREREFVEAAVAWASSTPRILFKEILPNLWAPILVYTSLLIPTFIAAEAHRQLPRRRRHGARHDLGPMLADSVTYFIVDPLYLFIPGMLLVVVCLTFNLLGDAVRDALDPRAGRS